MGSLEPLPGGNEFVGWGSANYFSEYNASGQMLLDAKLPYPGHHLPGHGRAVDRHAALSAAGRSPAT